MFPHLCASYSELRPLFPNVAKDWSPDEHQQLTQLFESGQNTCEIASKLRRPPPHISIQLHKLGLLGCRDCADCNNRGKCILIIEAEAASAAAAAAVEAASLAAADAARIQRARGALIFLFFPDRFMFSRREGTMDVN